MEAAMRDAARRLDFEQAAELRDRVRALKRQQVTDAPGAVPARPLS
jgi:protein-arginine kinase activator protein McsA